MWSINSNHKSSTYKIDNYHVLHTIVLVNLLLLEVGYYLLLLYKTKMENNYELNEIDIKIHISYYFDDITNANDLYLDNILFDKKSHENVTAYKYP